MDLSHLLQELQICKENVAIYKKLITFNLSFKHLLTTKNKEEWQLILLNIMEVLTSNQDMGKEWILLASHAFFILQSAQCDSESLQRYLAYFLEIDSSELFYINKTYKIIHLELFKLVITHGYLQVNQKKIYSNNVLCIIFKIIYPHCIQYTPYSYFAYKILNTWLHRSIYTDFWNTNSLLIEQKLEMIIFSNWYNSINDINKQNATYIFNIYLRIMIEKYNGFLEYIFNCIDSLSWQNETKYIILAEVCNMPKCKIAMITSEHFLLCLSTSLTKNHLRCVGTKVYMNILKRLTEKDWKKSFDTVIKYLVYQWEIEPNKNHNALKALCKYWLEPTIAKYKNILLHLWELCKDFAAPFFHSHLQRIANEMYITFPQDIDLIFYIHHKDEVIRLNGFAIYCYQSSKLLNNDKTDHFIIIKQFLWYNVNTTSIFLRDGITKYFKIFYTNILKTSENFGYNQYICNIVDWLHEFLLDCFEPGSRYQRKILGLNLYEVVLSITHTYFCKHLIEKEHNSPIMLHNKCTKEDIKCKFTNKKCLLVLLKLLQDSALDVKQTATYIIINYFKKDVLTNIEKKVIFDMGLKNCNSSKFYEVESGAALMKILSTWEPFNAEFITNKCEKSTLCNSYYEFFICEAQKQLLQMKEDILKAIVHNGSFYGILTAMLNCNFEDGLENCTPPLNFIKNLLDFLDDAITFFLSILSSKSTTTKYASSFAEMGLAINDTIKTSAINDDNYDDLILSPAHQVIVSCIWLSLKVSCEIVNNIGSRMYSNETTLHAIKLIAMVLTKCRHKGAIEAAGIAIGNLVRCICKKDNYAETLKVYVKNLLEDKTTNTLNITRRGAGFTLMFHKIVSNDNRKGRPLLHFAIQELLYSLESWSEIQFENIEYKYDLPLARHLYFLRTLVADKNLHVQLTPYMERISLVCFQYLRSEIWQIRNASLQLFGSIIPRLVGQSPGGKQLDFGNGYSVNHFITHYPILTNHILKQLQVFSQLSENSNTMLHEYSNIVHILILLSKFSISGCDFIDYLSYDFVQEMKSCFCKLLANPIEYIRVLTGKAYAALTAFSCIKSEIEILKFNIFLIKNVNKIHGHLLTIKYLKEKFLAEAENINSCKTIESIIINPDEKYISEYRIQNIVKIWNNKLKTKSNQQVYYTLECMLIELFNLKLSPSNIECFDKIILDTLCILHMEKIKPSFYQFIDNLTYLYADHIKYTGNFNSKIIDKIVHSEYIDQTINFLTHLHCFTPILKIILHILLSIIDNGNTLVINAMIKFIITTFKSSLLIDIYKLKLEEIVLILIPKLDKNSLHINVLHLKNILIAIFCKDEKVIYKILSAIFNMSLSDNEYIKNEALECLQFLVQRFSEVESKNKLIMMHCCLILLKNDTSDICSSVSTIVQNHIISTIYGSKKICEHDEIIYQQLLLEIEYYTSLCNSIYLDDNIEFIKQFIGLDKLHNKQSSLVENPFDHEDNTFYKEETKFMNILYFYMQSNKKYYHTLKYESNIENYIDVSDIIQIGTIDDVEQVSCGTSLTWCYLYFYKKNVCVMELERPDRLSRCTWRSNATNTPHTIRKEFSNRDDVLPNILEAIGQTPMVRLNNIPQLYGLECEIFAKCEFMNPGGSVKDRIAHRMIQDAEEKGILKPGSTIIEPTSGNTGIGLAMAAAVKGYRCVIVMPEKMSNEKVLTLRALGAEIIRTPTEAAWNSPESHISISQKLQKEIPNSVILDQYTNSGNPLAHYDQTAMEIWKQCDGKLDYVVIGAGTGGTVSGIGRKLKELHPEITIIAVDPIGSILAFPSELNEHDVSFYEVEGIGYDFLPTVLDRNVVDKWVKVNDCESLNAARMLIKQEGLLCGGSSGAALSAVLKIAKDIPAKKRVVVILPDGIRNYMTKFVCDNWMEIRGFLDIPSVDESNKWWCNYTVSTLSITKPPVLSKTATCQEAIHILKSTNLDQVVVIDNEEKVKGVLTMQILMSKLIFGGIKQTDCVENIMIKHFVKVLSTTTLIKLSLILEHETYVVVVDHINNDALIGIINPSDIVNFISNKDNALQTNGST